MRKLKPHWSFAAITKTSVAPRGGIKITGLDLLILAGNAVICRRLLKI